MRRPSFNRLDELLNYDRRVIIPITIVNGLNLRGYKDVTKNDKANKLKIEMALDLIPEELNRKNKRFVVADLKGEGQVRAA